MKRFKNWKPPIFDSDGWAYKELINDFPSGEYGWRCLKNEILKLGKDVDVGAFTLIFAHYGVDIGDDVQIGPGCFIGSYDTIDNKKGRIIIKNNVCIGAHAVILPNVIIGKNSIIGACSFVNKGTIIQDNEIWVGVPSKKIGYLKMGKRIYLKS